MAKAKAETAAAEVPMQNDKNARERVYNEISKYLIAKFGEPEIGENEKLVYTEVGLEFPKRRYRTSPYNVSLSFLLEDGTEVSDGAKCNIIGFTLFAETGYLRSEVDAILPGFIGTEDTIILDDETNERLPTNTEKIEAHNADVEFRAGDPARPAFTPYTIFARVNEVCEMSEKYIKIIPKGLQVSKLLNQARLILMNELSSSADESQENLGL